MADTKRKSLEDFSQDSVAWCPSWATLHQAERIPGGGTEQSLNNTKVPGLKMYYHPMQGLILENKGQWACVPLANVIIAGETIPSRVR